MNRKRVLVRLLIITGSLALALSAARSWPVRGVLFGERHFFGVGQGVLIMAYEEGGFFPPAPRYAAFWFDLWAYPRQIATVFVCVPLWFVALMCAAGAWGVMQSSYANHNDRCSCSYPYLGLPISASGSIRCPECGRTCQRP